MEADMPRPDLDDPVLRAYLAVYKSTVCQRAEENGDPCLRGAGSTCEGGLSTEPEGKKRRAKSASRQLSDKKDSHWLQPGLLSWQDKAKAWFWPRKGAVPPMETAVLALLNGSPPPLEATAQAALAARQQFAMPVLQKMQQAATRGLWPSEPGKVSADRPEAQRSFFVVQYVPDILSLFFFKMDEGILRAWTGLNSRIEWFGAGYGSTWFMRGSVSRFASFLPTPKEYLARTVSNQTHAIRRKMKDDILVSWRYQCERARSTELE
ncbi:unnamed protein product, partial [Effrenium voratum]